MATAGSAGPFSWDAKAHRAPPLSPRLIFAGHLWTLQWKRGIFTGMSIGRNTGAQKAEVLQGTLDLTVMKVLDALGPQHGDRASERSGSAIE